MYNRYDSRIGFAYCFIFNELPNFRHPLAKIRF